MVKKLLIAVLALGSLSFVPAEAGRGCCKPKRSCVKDTGCAAPTKQCSREKVLVRVDKIPCCKFVKVEGYRPCPVYKYVDTCTSVTQVPCPCPVGPCIYPGDADYQPDAPTEASATSADME